MDGKRTRRIEVRVSSEEYTAIGRRASEENTSISSYLRRCALGSGDIARLGTPTERSGENELAQKNRQNRPPR